VAQDLTSSGCMPLLASHGPNLGFLKPDEDEDPLLTALFSLAFPQPQPVEECLACAEPKCGITPTTCSKGPDTNFWPCCEPIVQTYLECIAQKCCVECQAAVLEVPEPYRPLIVARIIMQP
jgi:hypothetical protein